jgi:RNA polymerase sigma-70 factor (ECF subfamily)
MSRFQPMALAIALAGSDDAESARDACQSAFLLAWRRLRGLRDPDAFGGWLKRLVRTACARARRRAGATPHRASFPEPWPVMKEAADDPSVESDRRERASALWATVRKLPVEERRAVTLVYLRGETLEEAGRLLGVTTAHAGKLVHRARLRLRRSLPREIARAFLATAPTRAFTRSVEAGLLDEMAGEYRFPERPDHAIVLRREGSALVARAGGQTNVLTSSRPDGLAASEFDGEARFRRDARGRIHGFVYYEFGRRLGVARRVEPLSEAPARARSRARDLPSPPRSSAAAR